MLLLTLVVVAFFVGMGISGSDGSWLSKSSSSNSSSSWSWPCFFSVLLVVVVVVVVVITGNVKLERGLTAAELLQRASTKEETHNNQSVHVHIVHTVSQIHNSRDPNPSSLL